MRKLGPRNVTWITGQHAQMVWGPVEEPGQHLQFLWAVLPVLLVPGGGESALGVWENVQLDRSPGVPFCGASALVGHPL